MPIVQAYHPPTSRRPTADRQALAIAQWGLEIVGELHVALVGFKYLIIATYYLFTPCSHYRGQRQTIPLAQRHLSLRRLVRHCFGHP